VGEFKDYFDAKYALAPELYNVGKDAEVIEALERREFEELSPMLRIQRAIKEELVISETCRASFPTAA